MSDDQRDDQRDDGPNNDFVEVIERLLADAKAGKVTGVALAALRPSGDLATNICWADGAQAPLLIAATALLHQRAMVDTIVDLEDDDEELRPQASPSGNMLH